VRAFRMVSANVFMVPIKRRIGPRPGDLGLQARPDQPWWSSSHSAVPAVHGYWLFWPAMAKGGPVWSSSWCSVAPL
jgi:hypothetical protein